VNRLNLNIRSMSIQLKILRFVTRTNWILLFLAVTISGAFAPLDVALGVVAGGLIVTLGFHFTCRSLRKNLNPTRLASSRAIFFKHYLRFWVSIVLIYILISKNVVDPGGLLIGLSVLVASIMIASLCELKKIIFKEAI